jgi:ribose-phosphate pyrophosphokinase
MLNNPTIIFSGTSNPELAGAISRYLNMELGKVEISRFPTAKAVRLESTRSGCVHHQSRVRRLMKFGELPIFLDCVPGQRADTAVIPYFGYARQDRRRRPDYRQTDGQRDYLGRADGWWRWICANASGL